MSKTTICNQYPPKGSDRFWSILVWQRQLRAAVLQGKVSRAGLFLTVRQAAVMGVSLLSSTAVARWLGPDVVGHFAILVFVTQGVLGYFGDLGIKAALIRKPGQLDAVELATSQRIVIGFSLALASCIGAALPLAFRYLHLNHGNYLPAVALLILLLVRNLRIVPLAILERNLRFDVVGAVEVAEAGIYAVILATMAYRHYGIWAFVVAMMCRDLFGSTIFILAARPPWRQCRLASIRPHIKFSCYYQGGAFFNFIASAFPTVMLARLIGPREVGYVNFVTGISFSCLVICNALARMYLPAFSTVSASPWRLRQLVEKAVRINAAIAMPASAVLLSLSFPIIVHIFTSKWLPARPLLYGYCFGAVLTAVAMPLMELFFARNDAGFNFRLTGLWAMLTWTVGLAAVHYYGYKGYAAYCVINQAMWIPTFVHARRTAGVHLWAPVRAAFLFSFGLATVNWVLVRLIVSWSWRLLALVLLLEGLGSFLLVVRTIAVVKGIRVEGEAGASVVCDHGHRDPVLTARETRETDRPAYV